MEPFILFHAVKLGLISFSPIKLSKENTTYISLTSETLTGVHNTNQNTKRGGQDLLLS